MKRITLTILSMLISISVLFSQYENAEHTSLCKNTVSNYDLLGTLNYKYKTTSSDNQESTFWDLSFHSFDDNSFISESKWPDVTTESKHRCLTEGILTMDYGEIKIPGNNDLKTLRFKTIKAGGFNIPSLAYLEKSKVWSANYKIEGNTNFGGTKIHVVGDIVTNYTFDGFDVLKIKSLGDQSTYKISYNSRVKFTITINDDDIPIPPQTSVTSTKGVSWIDYLTGLMIKNSSTSRHHRSNQTFSSKTVLVDSNHRDIATEWFKK